jgi:hypothetical protein
MSYKVGVWEKPAGPWAAFCERSQWTYDTPRQDFSWIILFPCEFAQLCEVFSSLSPLRTSS